MRPGPGRVISLSLGTIEPAAAGRLFKLVGNASDSGLKLGGGGLRHGSTAALMDNFFRGVKMQHKTILLRCLKLFSQGKFQGSKSALQIRMKLRRSRKKRCRQHERKSGEIQFMYRDVLQDGGNKQRSKIDLLAGSFSRYHLYSPSLGYFVRLYTTHRGF